MKRRFTPLLLTLIFFAFQANAQIKISGYIIDTDEGIPLSFCNIALLQQSDSVFLTGGISDDKGFFSIVLQNSGSYFLRINYLGYKEHFLIFSIDSLQKQVQLGDIHISKEGQQLGEVVISASRPMYSIEGEKQIYNVTEDPSVQGGVATDALQNAPGIYVDMEGNITLRGVSGVEIWINDKPSRITGEGLKSFLEQLPANALDRIEVITNPSARYGAEGTAGIINIITTEKIKRNFLFSTGVNGSTRVSYSPWVSLVFGNEKVNVSTYFAHAHFEHVSTSNSSGFILNEGDTVYEITSYSGSASVRQWNYGHSNISWEIAPKTSLDFWVGGSFSSFESLSNSANRRNMYPNQDEFLFTKRNEREGAGYNMYSGLSFEKQFEKKGHRLQVNASTSKGNSKSIVWNEKVFSVQTNENIKYLQQSTDRSQNYRIDLHYENPFVDFGKIEIGGSLSMSVDANNNPIDTFFYSLDEYIYVPEFSNFTNQNRFQGASYSTYSDTLWGIIYKAGVRFEFAQTDLQSAATETPVLKNYGTLYPSFHASYKTKKNIHYSVGYSRRVRYPFSMQLDPFVNRIDVESVSFGNPLLNPSFSDSYEVSIARFFKSGNSLNTSLYHRRGRNEITNKSDGAWDELLDRYTIYTTYVNAAKSINTGLDVNARLQLSKNHRFMSNVNVFHQKYFADLESYIVDRENVSFRGRLNYFYNYKMLRFSLTAHYRAASADLQGTTASTYWINTAVNADFLNKKLSARLGFEDVFNQRQRRSTTDTPTYISISTSKRNTRFITFGFTLRFGKIELEKRQSMPQGGAPQGEME
jgi:outer membrane cobalamin receptor